MQPRLTRLHEPISSRSKKEQASDAPRRPHRGDRAHNTHTGSEHSSPPTVPLFPAATRPSPPRLSASLLSPDPPRCCLPLSRSLSAVSPPSSLLMSAPPPFVAPPAAPSKASKDSDDEDEVEQLQYKVQTTTHTGEEQDRPRRESKQLDERTLTRLSLRDCVRC